MIIKMQDEIITTISMIDKKGCSSLWWKKKNMHLLKKKYK